MMLISLWHTIIAVEPISIVTMHVDVLCSLVSLTQKDGNGDMEEKNGREIAF